MEQYASELFNWLNANAGNVLIVAALGVVGVMAQGLVKKLFSLDHELSNYVLALAAVPGLTTAVTAYLTPLHATAYPFVALAGQAVWAFWKWLLAYAASKAAPTALVPTAATFLDEPVQPTVSAEQY